MVGLTEYEAKTTPTPIRESGQPECGLPRRMGEAPRSGDDAVAEVEFMAENDRQRAFLHEKCDCGSESLKQGTISDASIEHGMNFQSPIFPAAPQDTHISFFGGETSKLHIYMFREKLILNQPHARCRGYASSVSV